jgi:hypothetical protein
MTMSLFSSLSGSASVLPPRIHIRDSNSLNWAGYAVETSFSTPQNGAVTDVKGSWTVPSVNTFITNSYSAFWVGIDGYSSGTVEQIGTSSDVSSSGGANYYAWYEIYPKYPVNLKMKISPGDIISAEVRYLGQGKFQLTITDKTKKTTFSTTEKSPSAKRSSAEWIAEAPSSKSGVLTLADFGSVTFSGTQATINGHTGSISDSAWRYDAIAMSTSSGTVKAQPYSLSVGGDSFSVAWSHQ